MSRTLFWYVFRDLLRIFLMTSGALAGIMSFGGLLRPLTEHGLDGSQVSKMLTYFMPAMTTYSFPIAALFAATMVYGRLSADNEITACRAGGISYWSMTAPAWVLGFSVALISLLFLCFIVPTFTLKVEQVIYSNLAQLVQNQIERTHQIKLSSDTGQTKTVYAQSAEVVPVTPEMVKELEGEHPKKHVGLQCVKMMAPMVVDYSIYEPPNNKDPNNRLAIPTTFEMAKAAYVYIEQDRDDVIVTVALQGASRFSRASAGPLTQARAPTTAPTTAPMKPAKDKIESAFYIGNTQVGPSQMNSPIKEDPKFMTITALRAMYERPETSRTLQKVLANLIKKEQAVSYLEMIMDAVNADGSFTFRTPAHEIVTLTRGERMGGLQNKDGELVFQSVPRPETRQVKLTVADADTPSLPLKTDEAMEMRIKATARWDVNDPQTEPTFDVSVEGFDVVIQTEEEEQASRHKKFTRQFIDVPMPAELAKMRLNDANYYIKSRHLSPKATKDLAQEQNKLLNRLESEIHSRASFAISCVVLVLVGCALGLLFRSSNFLSAFAVSFIPALLCIVLIVTGQQICNHATANNSLSVGITFIWSGNVLVLGLALVLLAKLQRT